MKRDAQATRQRILEAATAEFSQYGIAGARIDRIAAASGSNKSMIYVYFGSKEGLLDAVAADLIARHRDEVSLDVRDLPEFAARLYDQNQTSPEVVRLITWDRLERGGIGVSENPALEATASKIRVIEQAQQDGVVGRLLPAPLLFEFILALSQTGPMTGNPSGQADEHLQRRQALKDAVEALTRR